MARKKKKSITGRSRSFPAPVVKKELGTTVIGDPAKSRFDPDAAFGRRIVGMMPGFENPQTLQPRDFATMGRMVKAAFGGDSQAMESLRRLRALDFGFPTAGRQPTAKPPRTR